MFSKSLNSLINYINIIKDLNLLSANLFLNNIELTQNYFALFVTTSTNIILYIVYNNMRISFTFNEIVIIYSTPCKYTMM